MSPSTISFARDQSQRDLANSIQTQLGQLGREHALESRVLGLNRILDETFTSPALANSHDFADFEAALLSDIEDGLEILLQSSQELVDGHSPPPLQHITERKLRRDAVRTLTQLTEHGDQIELSLRSMDKLLQAAETSNHMVRLARLMSELEWHARWLDLALPAEDEDDEILQPEPYAAWFHEYTAWLLAEVAKLVSERFAGWEVRLGGQIVRGTGGGESERPVLDGSDKGADGSSSGEGGEVEIQPRGLQKFVYMVGLFQRLAIRVWPERWGSGRGQLRWSQTARRGSEADVEELE